MGPWLRRCFIVAAAAPLLLALPALAPEAPPAAAAGPFGAAIFIEENAGQAPDDVYYVAQTGEGVIHLMADGIRSLRGSTWFELEIPAATPAARYGIGVSNYFIGSDPSAWVTGARHVEQVRYDEVWPGVDLVVYPHARGIEYDWIVAPHHDASTILMAFPEATTEIVDGQLHVARDGGVEVHEAPYAYQDADQGRAILPSRFVERADGIGFEVVGRDPTLPLTIDPVVAYASFYGGSLRDINGGMDVTSDGDIIITAATRSPSINGPGTIVSGCNGCPDRWSTFVAGLLPDAETFKFATFIGSTDGDDRPMDLDLRPDGTILVGGETRGTDFPVVGGLGPSDQPPDGYAFIMGPLGNYVLWSTYMGGDGEDAVRAVGAFPNGEWLLAGSTSSTDLPVDHAVQGSLFLSPYEHTDGFFARYNNTLDLVALSYYGGEDDDAFLDIAVTPHAEAILVGHSESLLFPVSAPVWQPVNRGAVDGVIVRLNNTSQGVMFSTYLGGLAFDSATAVALESSGNIVVGGVTSSLDFPIRDGGQFVLNNGGPDAFVARLRADGLILLESTFFGGSSWETVGGVGSNAGETWLAGTTLSFDILMIDPFQAAMTPDASGVMQSDAYIVQYSGLDNIVFSSYAGGTEAETGVRLHLAGGSQYLAFTTDSDDILTVDPSQPFRAGQTDAFVMRLDPPPNPPPLEALPGGPYQGPAETPVPLDGAAKGGVPPYACFWTGPPGTFAAAADCGTDVTFASHGVYLLSLTVTDSVGQMDTNSTWIQIYEEPLPGEPDPPKPEGSGDDDPPHQDPEGSVPPPCPHPPCDPPPKEGSAKEAGPCTTCTIDRDALGGPGEAELEVAGEGRPRGTSAAPPDDFLIVGGGWVILGAAGLLVAAILAFLLLTFTRRRPKA